MDSFAWSPVLYLDSTPWGMWPEWSRGDLISVTTTLLKMCHRKCFFWNTTWSSTTVAKCSWSLCLNASQGWRCSMLPDVAPSWVILQAWIIWAAREIGTCLWECRLPTHKLGCLQRFCWGWKVSPLLCDSSGKRFLQLPPCQEAAAPF